jgi:hypothetical protein
MEEFEEFEDLSSYSMKELEQLLTLNQTTSDHYAKQLANLTQEGLFYMYSESKKIVDSDIEHIKKEIEKRKSTK